MRVCKKCGVQKETTEFHARKGLYAVGLNHVCKTCANARAREGVRLLRKRALTMYGGRCVCCGETTNEFLTFDHIEPIGGLRKLMKHQPTGYNLYKWLLQEQRTTMQILCYNCNCAKGFYGSCPHKRKEAT